MLKNKRFWLLAVLAPIIGFVVIGLLDKRPLIQTSEYIAAEEQAMQVSHSCPKTKHAFNIETMFLANVNNQDVFKSRLLFTLNLSIEGAEVKGLASKIRLFEQNNKEPRKIRDVRFLSSVNPDLPLLYLTFDSLGLPKQHPMLVIAQVLKNLSVVNSDKTYSFAYDLMQGQYNYSKVGETWQRQRLLTDSKSKHQWQVNLASACSVASMSSLESRPLSFGPAEGFITYKIDALAVNSNLDLSDLSFAPDANAHLKDISAKLDASSLEKEVKTAKKMWSIIQSFEQNNNTALLQRAADFMVENISVTELANHLTQSQLTETEKRNLTFALSLSSHNAADDYILDTINRIPKKAGEQVDVQKVRLMVALAGRDVQTRAPYDRLINLSDSTSESGNVKNNALVSAAMLANRLEQKGQTGAKQDLSERLSKNIQEDNEQTASSMLAVNNAGIQTLDQQMIPKLKSTNSKNRYAAATALANREQNYDLLINHMAGESDNLVNQVIVERIDPTKLSDEQRQKLADIASKAQSKKEESQQDKASLIEQLIAP